MSISDFLFKELREHAIASEKKGFDLAKYAVKQYLWNARRTIIPSKARVLPNFIIIGAQKGGTSSLYNNLVNHPLVVPAHRKEVKFFSHDTNFVKGLAWYRDHFPSVFYLAYHKYLRGRNLVTGEATPRYMFLPYVAERAATILPDARIIVILRDPVNRAYSHYHMAVRKKAENLPFIDAIEKAREEVDRLYSNGFALPKARADYLTRGIYVDQLKGWFENFPREQLLVIKSEGYYLDPVTTLKAVFDFIGVPAEKLAPYRRRRVREKYPPMSEDARTALVEFFRPHNERLYDFLQVDFGWSK